MSATTQSPAAAAPEPGSRSRLKLGFHTRVSFPAGQAGQALQDGIKLFQEGEDLGYDRGWVYQRHFDNYLAAPLVFLPVVAQHTTRISVGTAIIGIRYEDPILLAEAASTADLLSGGRLELGLAKGMGGYDVAFGQEPNDGRQQSLDRIDTFMRAIRGESVGEVNEPANGIAPGTPLTVRGASPTLADRVWFGGGSRESAERIAGQGLRLLMSTIVTGPIDDYNAYQADAIAAYHRLHTGPGRPRTSVSRSILPATSPETARLYAAYDAERRQFGPAASRPAGALDPTSLDSALSPAAAADTHQQRFTMSPAIHGEPADVVEQLLGDPAVQAADDLIAFLPPSFDLEQNLRLISDIAETVAPHLGWLPAPSRR
jgi:alkanesulfonate monooxygenase SsuD/methylene tetrahydromethanopterin reductase-like flavin-dependent oxidoreductase (luciferase family)